MLKKILKEIQKQEKERDNKLNTKKQLESEINEHNTRLKQLYSLKNDFEKLENNLDNYFNSEQDK